MKSKRGRTAIDSPGENPLRKTLLWIVAIVFLGGAISSLVRKDDKAEPAAAVVDRPTAPSDEAIEKTKKALEAEKQIKGVYYNPRQSAQWQIGMVNDGSSRAGYAGYVCEVLKENGAVAAGTRVKIIDIANLLVPERDRNLWGMGTVACDDGRVINAGDMRPVLVPSPGQ